MIKRTDCKTVEVDCRECKMKCQFWFKNIKFLSVIKSKQQKKWTCPDFIDEVLEY